MRPAPLLVVLLLAALAGCKRPTPHQYAKLDAKTLRSIPDKDLEDAIVDYVESKIGKDYEHEYQTVTRLPKGFQVIYTTAVVEGEVENGGFNQYFWNTDGKFRREAVEGFKLLGANAHAELMEEAVGIYEQHQETLKKYKQKGIEGFSESYKDNPLSVCDDKYYKLTGRLNMMRIKFIHEHPELFFGQ